MRKKRDLGEVLASQASGYCESTTLHGFSYWVNAKLAIERIFWVAVVVTFAIFAASIILSAVQDWIDNPAVTNIETFSKAIALRTCMNVN